VTDVETWTLLVGAVGAAAWIPQLAAWIARLIRRQIVSVLVPGQCEVGFTELGPVFNIQTAIAVNHREVLIDRVDIAIDHESGSTYRFTLHETSEMKGQVITSTGQNQPIFREVQAIAIKVISTDLKDTLLKNRMESYTKAMRKYFEKFIQEQRRLIINNAYNPQSFYASSVVQDMQAYMQSQMACTVNGRQ